MLCHLAEHRVLYSHAAKAYYNTDSVVYYDSTFSQEKQENDRFARFLVSRKMDAYSIIAEEKNALFPCLLRRRI